MLACDLFAAADLVQTSCAVHGVGDTIYGCPSRSDVDAIRPNEHDAGPLISNNKKLS